MKTITKMLMADVKETIFAFGASINIDTVNIQYITEIATIQNKLL